MVIELVEFLRKVEDSHFRLRPTSTELIPGTTIYVDDNEVLTHFNLFMHWLISVAGFCNVHWEASELDQEVCVV